MSHSFSACAYPLLQRIRPLQLCCVKTSDLVKQRYLPSNLVAQWFAGDDGNLLTHPLVGVEVISKPRVILLNNDPGSLLNGLGPDTTLRANATLSANINFLTNNS